jgi:Concanavalin A-like lectin/glucanases superfamily
VSGGRAWAARITPALAAGALVACSLLAPSGDELEGAYREDAGVEASALPHADAGCALGTKACATACASIASPATGCAGESCEPCRAAHAAPLCVGGACALGPCENGWANCNGRAEDGCEVDTRASAQFCGSCLVSCGQSTPRCEQGECVPACRAIKLTSTAAHLSLSATGMGFGAGDFTVELWLKQHTDFANQQAALFVSNESYSASSIILAIHLGRYAACKVTEPIPSGAPGLEATIPTDAAWHHVACVRRAGALGLFVDGVERAAGPNGESIVVPSTAALGRPAGSPSLDAAPLFIGPTRISRVARYAGAFTPRTFWGNDADTIALYLTSRGFDGTTIHDEAGGDNDATSTTGVIATTDTPCP